MDVAVVLAAGSGTRFVAPGHKLRARLDGAPVLAHAVDHAVASGLAVVVVTGADDFSDLLPTGVHVVTNADWAAGAATSLRAGIGAAEALGAVDAVVVALGDQPGISPEAWRSVASSGADLAVATYDGRPGPHPVRIAARFWPELPVSGDEGARVLLAAHRSEVEAIPCIGNPVDIDTPEDLARWS